MTTFWNQIKETTLGAFLIKILRKKSIFIILVLKENSSTSSNCTFLRIFVHTVKKYYTTTFPPAYVVKQNSNCTNFLQYFENELSSSSIVVVGSSFVSFMRVTADWLFSHPRPYSIFYRVKQQNYCVVVCCTLVPRHHKSKYNNYYEIICKKVQS